MMTKKLPIKIAIMGCVVNGPGEAKEADVGIAGGGWYRYSVFKGEYCEKISPGKTC